MWRSDQSESQQFSNDGAGIDALEQQPRQLPVGLLVLEATGGYEFEAAYTLQASGLAVAVVNPRMARDFARAMGLLAKTDALDARMLTGFAQVLHQHPQRDRFIAVGRCPVAAITGLGVAPTTDRADAHR